MNPETIWPAGSASWQRQLLLSWQHRHWLNGKLECQRTICLVEASLTGGLQQEATYSEREQTATLPRPSIPYLRERARKIRNSDRIHRIYRKGQIRIHFWLWIFVLI